MQEYGKILLIAMPIFTLLIIIEKIYGYLKGEHIPPLMDTISSLSSGLTNTVKDVLGLSVSILTYSWLVRKVAIFQIDDSPMAYVIAFIVIDFQGYWTHRIAHEINFFWNKHAIHHSSEEFDLPCALRQSVSSFVNLFTFFLLPAALLGVPLKVIAIVAPLHLFAQFWYHTRYIDKMGFLEKIIVTPSHHRVHHAFNPEYLDKNYGQIFIIWDKIFGTFQAELPDVPPVFGITVPARTWNPIKINFQHLGRLAKDAWYTSDWKDKLRIWFMPTGWRPADVAEKYPVDYIKDAYHFEKYGQNNPTLLSAWAFSQMIITFSFLNFFFATLSDIGKPGIFVYGAFLFLSVYSYTELMDKKSLSLVWESLRLIFGASIIYFYGDWFGLNAYISYGNYLVLGYLLLSWGVNGLLVLQIKDFIPAFSETKKGL